MTGAQNEKPIIWKGLPGAGGVYYVTDENDTQQIIYVHDSETPPGRAFPRRVLLAPVLAELVTDLFGLITNAQMANPDIALLAIRAEHTLKLFYHGEEGA